MRKRFRSRPLSSVAAVLAYLYTVHNGRVALREGLVGTRFESDSELYAAASTYFVSAGAAALLYRWRVGRRLSP